MEATHVLVFEHGHDMLIVYADVCLKRVCLDGSLRNRQTDSSSSRSDNCNRRGKDENAAKSLLKLNTGKSDATRIWHQGFPHAGNRLYSASQPASGAERG